MKVLYDHQAFMQIIGGVSRSYVELIKHLNPEIEREISIKYSRNSYIHEILPKVNYPFGRLYIPFKRRLIRKENFKHSIKSLVHSNYDIFHSTFDDAYFLPYVKAPYVMTVHDLIPEQDPEKWSEDWIRSRKQLFEPASHIIAVSQNTKNELLHYYPEITETKVTVIHHGYSETIMTHGELENKYGDYILFVGIREGYKNFDRFIEAVAPILLANKKLKLICTASKLTKSEHDLLIKLGIHKKVIAKKVDDYTLKALYKHAIVFVFPSLIEGFGIPILEAWGNGCPIALSNTSCFPEIAGDAAIYFDPTDVNSIKNVILQVIENIDFRKELINKGNERLKLFTWEIAAKKIEQVYRNVLESK